MRCAAKACQALPHLQAFPRLCFWGGGATVILALRLTCARQLLGEPEDTLDEKSCLVMPSWLASPGCRLNMARLKGLALGLCEYKTAELERRSARVLHTERKELV